VSIIWTAKGPYQRSRYTSEADLEGAVLQVKDKLFGSERIYLDVKRRIGAKGSLHNVPDGYLLDLTGSKPRLYVVENELASHDPLRHIAVQILQFSLSFQDEPRAKEHPLPSLARTIRCEDTLRGLFKRARVSQSGPYAGILGFRSALWRTCHHR
jgi:hypothetical protein